MAEQVDLTTIPISPNGDNSADAASSADMEGKVVTVFHDKDNFNVKHPLQNRWTLWFTKPASGKVSLLHRLSFPSHLACNSEVHYVYTRPYRLTPLFV